MDPTENHFAFSGFYTHHRANFCMLAGGGADKKIDKKIEKFFMKFLMCKIFSLKF